MVSNRELIHTLFEEQAKQHPDYPAIIQEETTFSYRVLNEKANQLAHYLLNLSLEPDKPIAICMERSGALLVNILAVLKSGCAWLPLDPSHPAERLHFILQDADSPILITDSSLKAKFVNYTGILLCPDEKTAEIARESSLNPDLSPGAESLAYVIYTSGSTGTPKGVLIEHASVINYGAGYADACKALPCQRVDFSSNPCFDMAVTVSIIPLILGQTLVICPDYVKKDLTLYLEYLNRQQIDMIKLTPSYFKVLLMEVTNNRIDLPCLKTILLGGEQLMAAECRAWLDLYPEHLLFNEYGPTESTVGISIYKIDCNNAKHLENQVPIGYCLKDSYCHILDADKKKLPEGEAGELYIGGACLARGYLNRPELTAQLFIHDPFNDNPGARLYKTGDLCRRLDNGLLEYLGRIDNQVKIRGFRIEPEEIEKRLAEHPAIAGLAVVAREDAFGEKRLIAYFIVKKDREKPSREALHAFLGTTLPRHMIPEGFFEIQALPLTANGKLDIKALPIPEFTASQVFTAPKTALEKVIADIWAKELRLKKIGLEDDFFELGGHSLSAARILSEINARFKKNIAMQDFYQAGNIAKFIPLLQNCENTRESPVIPDTQPGQIPLSEFQFMLWIMNTFEPETQKLNITARKRFRGRLNMQAFEFALNSVIKKQEVLRYQIQKFRPEQQTREQPLLHFQEENISHLSPGESEEILEKSMKALIEFYPWPRNSPLFFVRLFYLDQDISEIQICMSHMISDDTAPDILLADLSRYYLAFHRNGDASGMKPDPRYKKYIQEEQHYYQKHFDRDKQFWDSYLKDTALFNFPADYILKNMQDTKTDYSTYTEIPEQSLQSMKHFCAKHHISLNDGLCAAMVLVLSKYSRINDDQNIFVNRVKSTRENPDYDETIGCFLRLEPVKVRMRKTADLEQLSTEIHQSSLETSPYQRCPGLVKLTSTQTFRKTESGIINFLANIGSNIYAWMFNIPATQRKILNECSGPLITFDRQNNYLININVHSNFIKTASDSDPLFGLDNIKVSHPQYDLLNIDNCLDVCFMRNEAENKPWLVISANLQPDFRELVAKEVIHILDNSKACH